ncbi:MAG: GNAT family N-acetyltransferase [Rhodothermales bacterium]
MSIETLTPIHELTAAQTDQLHRMYQKEWWTRGRTREEIDTMLSFSDVVFGFCEPDTDRLAAFARVLTDRVYKAFIFDVIVDASHRNQGVGRTLMEAICEHPALAEVRHVELYCLPELIPFYQQWGFSDDPGRIRLMRRERVVREPGQAP